MEVDQLQNPPVATGQEYEWGPETVWTFRGR